MLKGGTAGSSAHLNPASAVIGRSTTHLNPAGSSYRDPTSVWCDTTACAGSMAFSKNAAQPYGMSLTCQWFRYAPPGASPFFPTPSISGTSNGGVIRASISASFPPSPHAQTSPCASIVGRANAHDRGFDLTRSSSSRELACGMSAHFPSASNLHAWYAHRSVPSSSTRPSDSGARRCGHLSSNALHRPSPSLHTTRSTPRSCVGCGFVASIRSITATGYHCFVQLNDPAVGDDPSAAALTIGTRSGVMPMSGFPAVASRSSSSAEIVVPPVALSLDVAVALARGRATTRRAVAAARHRGAGAPRERGSAAAPRPCVRACISECRRRCVASLSFQRL